jgi:hypothetical protein
MLTLYLTGHKFGPRASSKVLSPRWWVHAIHHKKTASHGPSSRFKACRYCYCVGEDQELYIILVGDALAIEMVPIA